MQSGARAAFLSALTRFDREKLNAVMALRNTVGVVLPLAAATLLHQPSLGLVAALGAMNVAYSDGTDPYRIRGRRMLVSTVFCSLALAVGGLTGRFQVTAIALAALWAFVTGMLVALGTTAADIGTISLVTLVVFAARPLTPTQAALSGLVACCGGLFQTGLSLLFWPARKYQHERRVLAGVYTELSRLATQTVAPGTAPLATTYFTTATQLLSALSADHSAEAESINSMFSQAERIRVRLLTLGRLRRRLLRDVSHPDAPAALDIFLEDAAQVLAGITEGADTSPLLAHAQGILDELRNRAWPGVSTFHVALTRDAVQQMDALAGQLRSVIRLSNQDGVGAPSPVIVRPPPRDRNQMEILHANLTLKSVAFRHAIRLAACVAIGDALGRGFDWQRSYWIPMTIAIILKPDFLSTFSRGALRFAGTFFGLILSTALYHVLPAGMTTDILFVATFTLLLRWLGPANYGILTLSVSGLVVALLAGTGVAPSQVILLRGMNTAIGGGLAMLAYALWPTWERTQIAEALARLFDAYRAYLQAVRQHDHPDLDRIRQSARIVRTNLEASVDRLSVEPGAKPEFLRPVAGILASSHDFIYAVMTFESAALDEVRGHEGCRPALHAFFDQVELMLYFLSAALRGSPGELKDLTAMREHHRLLAECARANGLTGTLLVVETDRMTNALNTMREQVLPWMRATVPVEPADRGFR